MTSPTWVRVPISRVRQNGWRRATHRSRVSLWRRDVARRNPPAARLRSVGAIGAAIRLFRRDFDAVLLGPLSSMGVLQPDVRVRYRLGNRLMLEAKGETAEVPIGFIDRCAS